MGNCISSSNEEISILKKCNNKNTEYFTPYDMFKNSMVYAKVVNVIDGDTVDLAVTHKDGNIFKYRTRLYGINSPEMHPLKTHPNRENEINAAFESKRQLINKLREDDDIVKVVFHTKDKYGRYLCSLFDSLENNINKWMVMNNYAVTYFGGKRL